MPQTSQLSDGTFMAVILTAKQWRSVGEKQSTSLDEANEIAPGLEALLLPEEYKIFSRPCEPPSFHLVGDFII
jgi:hypothetical protein